MFSDEVKKMLVQVITSWQVLAVTGVLIVYIFIVNSVARLYRRRRPDIPPLPKEKSQPLEAPPPQAAPQGEDELGLEEETTEE